LGISANPGKPGTDAKMVTTILLCMAVSVDVYRVERSMIWSNNDCGMQIAGHGF